eukprot:tig00020829_g14376.t1
MRFSSGKRAASSPSAERHFPRSRKERSVDDMGDKREAAAAVPEATAAPVFKELEPARKRRRRTQPARGGPTAQTLTLAAPDFLCCETEPVGYLKFTHILPFLKDGLKVRLFVAKIDVYVVDEGFFFVGIGILVPKLGSLGPTALVRAYPLARAPIGH